MLKRILYAGVVVFLSTGAPSAHADREVGKGSPQVRAIIRDVSQASHPHNKRGVTPPSYRASAWQHHQLHSLRERVHHLQRVMHEEPSRSVPGIRRQLSGLTSERVRYSVLIREWQGLLALTSSRYQHPSLKSALLCIHRYEGAWADTSNRKYHGGLQMDEDFELRYAPYLVARKGHAYNWTPLEQIWTAQYAVTGPDKRGFSPWPQTAEDCGLI